VTFALIIVCNLTGDEIIVVRISHSQHPNTNSSKQSEESRPPSIIYIFGAHSSVMMLFYYRVEPYKHNNYMVIDNHTEI
jgi:hypothetical protein